MPPSDVLSAVVSEGAIEIVGGTVARSMVHQKYPNLPPQIGCALVYWADVVNPVLLDNELARASAPMLQRRQDEERRTALQREQEEAVERVRRQECKDLVRIGKFRDQATCLDQSQSILDNLLALLGQSSVWNCSDPERSDLQYEWARGRMKCGPGNVRYLAQFGEYILSQSFTARDPKPTFHTGGREG